MQIAILNLLKTSIIVWIYFYGFCSITGDVLFNTLPLSFLGIVILSLTAYFFHVPTPSQASVHAVIGADPLLEGSENEFTMRVVAHRGAGLDAPENSLIAFKMCADKGCSGIEFDVSLTADDVPVIFHDDTLERLTYSGEKVKEMTWEQLSSIDISVKHPLKEKFQGTQITKLEDTVLQCLENKQRMFIDIKETDLKIVKVILDLYKKYPELETKAVCSSFHPHVIYMIRRGNKKIVCSLAWRPNFYAYESYSALNGVNLPRTSVWYKHFYLKCLDSLYSWAFHRFVYYIVGISVVLLHKDTISGKVISDWREKGIRVIAWTVNHPVEKQHFSRILKITYMTDTLIGETTAHANTNTARNSSNTN